MEFVDNKSQGNFGLGIAIAYFTTNGYTVSIPLNDTQDYDLVVEKENILKTVQVKTTSCKTRYGKYQVALKSCGGTKGDTYKTVRDTKVDFLFIVATDLSIYIIPRKEIKNKSTLNLCDNYEKYRKNPTITNNDEKNEELKGLEKSIYKNEIYGKMKV